MFIIFNSVTEISNYILGSCFWKTDMLQSLLFQLINFVVVLLLTNHSIDWFAQTQFVLLLSHTCIQVQVLLLSSLHIVHCAPILCCLLLALNVQLLVLTQLALTSVSVHFQLVWWPLVLLYLRVLLLFKNSMDNSIVSRCSQFPQQHPRINK